MSWNGFTSEWLAEREKSFLTNARPNPSYPPQRRREAAKKRRGDKPSKMRNKTAYRDGIRFDSEHEAKYYDYLRHLQAAGQVKYFHRQVPVELTGGVVYRVDFLVFWRDGRVTYDDPKGRETPLFRLKKKQAEALYPIQIRVIKKGDFPEVKQ